MKKQVKDVFAHDQVKGSEVIQLLYQSKKLIIQFSVGFLILGIIYHFSVTKEYESVSAKLSEIEDSELGGMGQLSGLAGLAGMSLPGSSNKFEATFPPELYPQLVYSKPFLKSLLEEEFYFQNIGKRVTLKEYLLRERPRSFLGKIKDWVFETLRNLTARKSMAGDSNFQTLIESETQFGKDFQVLTQQEEGLIGFLQRKIKIENEGKVINLSVKLSDPLASAELNSLIFHKIIDFVTNYRTEKQRINLGFIEQRATEAEENFVKAQVRLASFRDSNQGLISQQARSREEQLQAEYSMAFNIYNGLRQELESARLQLKNNTPIFTSFINPSYPTIPSNLSFPVIVILSAFLGAFFGILFVAGKLYIEYQREV